MLSLVGFVIEVIVVASVALTAAKLVVEDVLCIVLPVMFSVVV